MKIRLSNAHRLLTGTGIQIDTFGELLCEHGVTGGLIPTINTSADAIMKLVYAGQATGVIRDKSPPAHSHHISCRTKRPARECSSCNDTGMSND